MYRLHYIIGGMCETNEQGNTVLTTAGIGIPNRTMQKQRSSPLHSNKQIHIIIVLYEIYILSRINEWVFINY